LLACRLSLATPLGPRIALRRTPPYANIHEKGSAPFFAGLILRTSHTPRAAYVDFYTGERLAMGSTVIGSAPSLMST